VETDPSEAPRFDRESARRPAACRKAGVFEKAWVPALADYDEFVGVHWSFLRLSRQLFVQRRRSPRPRGREHMRFELPKA
jgi:hypothetical protein